MEAALTILQRYWKHTHFRPMQTEIIQSLVEGHDTLALLPTGGGKSICFQVPGLMLEGVCIVVSPLIALMKDQVEGLRERGVEAVAVHTGLSREQIDLYLNNCIYGTVKFLYISPERIHTEIFSERVKQMKVSMIAVDEAHCISQWGYDFRPSYLLIRTLRDLVPQAPLMALTATATRQVREDILQQLAFRKDHRVFQRTFARDNLSFVVRKTESKDKKLLEVIQKVKGSSILYVRSRKATEDVAAWLAKKNISATYYHAGLTFQQRTDHQELWIKGHVRVMVATNAFGMGIDKPDVRVVVHLDLPDNLESYYQEAGRAGRDGQPAFAVVIFHEQDVTSLQTKVMQAHPSVDYLRQVYQAVANYFQLAEGSAANESFDFDLYEFTQRFKLHPGDVYAALRKLEEEGLIQFNESFYNPSQLHVNLDTAKLYEFQIAHARFDPVIKMILRLYGGQLYSDFVKISENYLAKALKMPSQELVGLLKQLHELRVVTYQPVKDKPQITFLTPRQDAARLPLDIKRLESRKQLALDKMNAMIRFVTDEHVCRMEQVLDYFDETRHEPCGKCDVCIRKRKQNNAMGMDLLRAEIMTLLKQGSFTVEQLEEHINPADPELFVDVVRDMVDAGAIEYDDAWQLRIKAG